MGESTDLKKFFVGSLSKDHTLYPQPYVSMLSTHNPMQAGCHRLLWVATTVYKTANCDSALENEEIFENIDDNDIADTSPLYSHAPTSSAGKQSNSGNRQPKIANFLRGEYEKRMAPNVSFPSQQLKYLKEDIEKEKTYGKR